MIIPYWLWAVMVMLLPRGKSMGNLAESLLLALIVATILAVRMLAFLGKSRISAAVTLVLGSAAGVALWALLPALPE
ncbi:MAG TPA: hypothetical protein VNL70_02370 [Tepidisphaeraceae bacterium]|nr:hypothetical protein [Tepidisphaeraceae bacterium]